MNKFVPVLTAIFITGSLAAIAQEHRLVKIWQTDSSLKVPESVLYDAANNVLYVSNIDGEAGGKDGKGSIGKVAPDGKIIQVDWVTGLNAPKGLGVYKGNLYVADLTEVDVIDIKSGKITSKIPIEGSSFLNDLTIDKNGIVFVSDSRKKKVHRIEKGKVSTILDSLSLKGPNGLLSHGNDVYVLDAGTMYKISAGNKLSMVAEGMESSTDGIENVAGNDFIVSSWNGVVYYIHADGSKETLLDTREQKIKSADIGFNASKKIVYVPTFMGNSIVAYELK